MPAAQAWLEHLGELVDAEQVLARTGWSRQEFHEAMRAHRVLRLQDDDHRYAYLMAGFADNHPARPLPGIEESLRPWAEADPRGWLAASWLMSPQAELGGRTPRNALTDAAARSAVVGVADQAVARLGVGLRQPSDPR